MKPVPFKRRSDGFQRMFTSHNSYHRKYGLRFMRKLSVVFIEPSLKEKLKECILGIIILERVLHRANLEKVSVDERR